MSNSDPAWMLFFISSSAVAPRDVEQTDVRCQCRNAGLNCTDLCACGDDEPCVNCPSHPSSDQEDDDEDNDEDTS